MLARDHLNDKTVLARDYRLKETSAVRFKRFDLIAYSRHCAALHRVFETADAIKTLHQALPGNAPDCNAVALFAGGFKPHLSLGQTRSLDMGGILQPKATSP